METRVLEEIGLSKNEVKVYLALLEVGPSSAGAILNKAEVQNSVLHFCLNNLITKGLVSYIKKSKVRVYQAANPQSLLEYVSIKQEEVKKILPELIERQNKNVEKEEVEMFEGIKGIKTALNLLIDNVNPKEEFLFFSAYEENNKEIQDFYRIYDSKRKSKKLLIKGIAPKNLRELFRKRPYLKMKYSNFPVPENTGMCGNRMVIISWGTFPRAILITSKIIVSKQKEFFNEVWNSIKKS